MQEYIVLYDYLPYLNDFYTNKNKRKFSKTKTNTQLSVFYSHLTITGTRQPPAFENKFILRQPNHDKEKEEDQELSV